MQAQTCRVPSARPNCWARPTSAHPCPALAAGLKRANPQPRSSQALLVRATANAKQEETYLQHLPSALNLAGAAFSAYCQPEQDTLTGKDQVFWFADWPARAKVTWPSDTVPIQHKCAARPKDELQTTLEWQEQANLAREVIKTNHGTALKDLKPLAYVEVGCSDTQFWLYGDLNARVIVLAFRGTSGESDMLTDARLLLAKGWKGTDKNVWMHKGFKHGYVTTQPLMHALLNAVLRTDRGPWQVYCTGHSLGGALATLAAFDLTNTTQWGTQAPPAVSLHTFGSPRVGNGRFRDLLQSKIQHCWRWANQGDPVTRVPFMVYRHARTKVLLNPDGTLVPEVVQNPGMSVLASIWDAVEDFMNGDDDDEVPEAAIKQVIKKDQEENNNRSDTDYGTIFKALKDLKRSDEKTRVEAPVAMAAALDNPNNTKPTLSTRINAIVAPHLQPAYFANFKAAIKRLKPQEASAPVQETVSATTGSRSA